MSAFTDPAQDHRPGSGSQTQPSYKYLLWTVAVIFIPAEAKFTELGVSSPQSHPDPPPSSPDSPLCSGAKPQS